MSKLLNEGWSLVVRQGPPVKQWRSEQLTLHFQWWELDVSSAVSPARMGRGRSYKDLRSRIFGPIVGPLSNEPILGQLLGQEPITGQDRMGQSRGRNHRRGTRNKLRLSLEVLRQCIRPPPLTRQKIPKNYQPVGCGEEAQTAELS